MGCAWIADGLRAYLARAKIAHGSHTDRARTRVDGANFARAPYMTGAWTAHETGMDGARSGVDGAWVAHGWRMVGRGTPGSRAWIKHGLRVGRALGNAGGPPGRFVWGIAQHTAASCTKPRAQTMLKKTLDRARRGSGC
eukprot:10589767-Lingulodinium_polyedra.AAC.2